MPPTAWDAYPRPSVTADIVIFTIALERREGRPRLPEPELRVQLIRRAGEPFAGSWAIPGGFLEPGETLQEAATRELEEETGLTGMPLYHMDVYSTPNRDPRGWVVSSAYCALVDSTNLQPRGGSDAAEARWWSVSQAINLDLAFDHRRMLGEALQWVRRHVRHSLVIRDFLPEEFVLSDLYAVVRAVLPEYQETHGNFRRKLVHRGLIEPTGNKVRRYSRREAEMFRFTGKMPEISIL